MGERETKREGREGREGRRNGGREQKKDMKLTHSSTPLSKGGKTRSADGPCKPKFLTDDIGINLTPVVVTHRPPLPSVEHFHATFALRVAVHQSYQWMRHCQE